MGIPVVSNSNPHEEYRDELPPTDDDGYSVGSDEDDSVMSDATKSEETMESERDEKQEVYKMSAKDTFRVRLWRVAVTVMLLLTACAVTLTTYKFLKDEEKHNFETAFDRFSQTLADATLEEQQNIRDTMRTLAGTVAAQAKKANQTWPMVDLDMFEIFGGNALRQANVEYISFVPRVANDQVDNYLEFINANIERLMQSAHMIKYGDLSRLRNDTDMYAPYIQGIGRRGFGPDNPNRTEYYPSQQYSPPLSSYMIVNHNIGDRVNVALAIEAVKALQYETVFTISNNGDRTPDFILGPQLHATYHSQFKDSDTISNPHVYAIGPLHEDPTDPLNSEIVGIITNGMAFDASLLNLLPEGVEGILCVLSNDKNQTFTYEVVGQDAFFLGWEDHHEPKYEEYAKEVDLALHTNPLYRTTEGHAQYKMHIYPTDRFRSSYDSNTPEAFAIAVAVTFVLVAIIFFVYDMAVFKRNENLVAKAAQSNAIVTSLFPEHMREALMKEKEEDQIAKDNAAKKKNLRSSLRDGSYAASSSSHQQKPLADLYLETTVLFADISGFTAWSSVREPSQVFLLLENIFQCFDKIAKKRKVFKVETVGDCYVAVAGLPDPREDHALMIARFARDILGKFRGLTKQLEITLGPDTADLDLRIGIHSGQVTAGVLRGDRARFQLFGDTMNVCQRVEATGKGGRIHASKETADVLRKMGKEAWLEKRTHTVSAKGLGILETYWVNPSGDRAGSVTSRASVGDLVEIALANRTCSVKPIKGLDARMNRLINWNVEMLLDLMQQIVARRSAKRHMSKRSLSCDGSVTYEPKVNPLDEVKEIIALPAYDAATAAKQQDPSTVKIPEEVVTQLHLLVSEISLMYNDNPFHNFDHASHVVMSVIKLMSRIVAPSHLDGDADEALHDHTYGITSDPLTHFACAFSALIHDADHQGVSNAQLVKEGVPIAEKYKERSVAEQNSLDLTWSLLMEPRFDTFRSFLFSSEAELQRFRQLVVNSVMSTDIVDKDLKGLRNARWDKAFKKAEGGNETSDEPTPSNVHDPKTARDAVNRKATIVIEHIIQASDISHTMQHWHVYRKWNQHLFEELYVAYLNGRMEKNPVEFWYKGEFGFFDFYIIPLTRKLKECGVFGVSSDEFLNYATKNREMWELHGEEAVAEMAEEVKRKYGVKQEDGTVVSNFQSDSTQEQAPPLPMNHQNEVDV